MTWHLQIESKLPNQLWPEMVSTAVWILNRIGESIRLRLMIGGVNLFNGGLRAEDLALSAGLPPRRRSGLQSGLLSAGPTLSHKSRA